VGAAAAFDYNDPGCAKKIKQFANDDLQYVWDTISEPASAKICSDSISAGGTYGSLLNVQFPRDDVKCLYTLGYTVVGEPVTKGPNVYVDTSQDFAFCKKWIEYVEGLLHEGGLKAHPITAKKGFENVLDGVDLLRQNKVSGKKLVYVV
jgi:hypothetical protein